MSQTRVTLQVLAILPTILAFTASSSFAFSSEPLKLQQIERETAVFALGQSEANVSVEIENISSKTVKYDSIVISCGCISSDAEPKELAPGEKSTMYFVVDTEKTGKQGATIKLLNSELESPLGICEVKFEVSAPYAVKPESVLLENVSHSDGAKFTLEIVDGNSTAIPKDQIIVDPLSDRIQLLSIEDGRINLQINPGADISVTKGFVLIRVPTLSPLFELRHQIEWQYRKIGFEVVPNKLYAGRITKDDTAELNFAVVSHEADEVFKIEDIEIAGGIKLQEWSAKRGKVKNHGGFPLPQK